MKPGEKVAIFVGAFERKGLAVSIDALAQMPESARLVAVGSGDVQGFRTQAERLGVADRVVFVGHTKNVAPLFRAADIFLLPTLYEPFGLVIFEAMASGLPVLASRLAGASEWIRDGESGALLDHPETASSVARRWQDATREETQLARWSVEARKIAVARSWDAVAREYEAVLAPLMEGNSA